MYPPLYYTILFHYHFDVDVMDNSSVDFYVALQTLWCIRDCKQFPYYFSTKKSSLERQELQTHICNKRSYLAALLKKKSFPANHLLAKDLSLL